MVPDHVVRHWDDAGHVGADERVIHRVGDVDVDLDSVLEPVVAELAALRLEQAGFEDRRAEGLLGRAELFLPLLVPAGQAQVVAQGIGENAEVEAGVVGLEVVLVQKDEVLGQLARLIVGTYPLGQGSHVDAHGLGEPDLVRLLFAVLASVVMDPEDVVVFGQAHRTSELQLKLFVDRVPDPVALGELLPGCPLDQIVDLGLAVVVFRPQGHLQREPDEAGVLPPVELEDPDLLGDLRQGLEDVEDAGERRLRDVRPGQQPPRELGVGRRRELVQPVVGLPLAEECIVREEEVVQERSARFARDHAPDIGAFPAAIFPRAGRDGERPLHLLVEDPDLLVQGMAQGETGVGGGKVGLDGRQLVGVGFFRIRATAVENGHGHLGDPPRTVSEARDRLVEG